MKTKEEIRIEFYGEHDARAYDHDELYIMEQYAKEYHEQQVNLLNKPAVSGCFYLQSEKLPDNSGEYEVITNRGRVIKIKYKLFEDNGIWECEYGKHEINESVVAWRFLK